MDSKFLEGSDHVLLIFAFRNLAYGDFSINVWCKKGQKGGKVGGIKREESRKGKMEGEGGRRGMTVGGERRQQAGGREGGRVSRYQQIMVTSSGWDCTAVLC